MPKTRTLISQEVKTKQENNKTKSQVKIPWPQLQGQQAQEGPYFDTCNPAYKQLGF